MYLKKRYHNKLLANYFCFVYNLLVVEISYIIE